jgi:hypothetical protein
VLVVASSARHGSPLTLQLGSRSMLRRSIGAQDVEQGNSLEDLAYPSRDAHNLQLAVPGNGHVVRADEFAHACRVDSRDSGQVQHDMPLATPEERPDAVPQFPIDRRAQWALDVKDGEVL